MFKKLVIALSFLGLMGSLYANEAAEKAPSKETYKVDAKKSSLLWTGTKVTGKHFGNIALKGGQIEMKNGRLVGGQFVVDMNSITVTDGTEGEWLTKLINHLKSDDFFSTNKYKQASLKIRNSVMGKGGAYDVSADLTIKGITKPVSFMVDVNEKGNIVNAKTKITFDRLDYGITFRSGKFFQRLGDKLIHDKVTVDVNIMARK